jgi:hypothetical protein
MDYKNFPTKPMEDTKTINETLSIFDGVEPSVGTPYDTSWDCVMPLWFKILGMDDFNKLEFVKAEVGANHIYIEVEKKVGEDWETKLIYHNVKTGGTMISVYNHVMYEFIKWYTDGVH